MARNRTAPSLDDRRNQVFWLTVLVFGAVILFLALMIYAIVAISALNTGPPRTAMERQVRVLQNAVAQNPGDAVAWGDYIKTLVTIRRFAAAERGIADADKALKKRTGQVAIEHARLALYREDLDEAVKRGEEALAVAKKEREAEAEKLAAGGVSAPPEPGVELEAALLLGEIYVQAGQPDKALEAYDLALDLNPVMTDIYVERARLLIDEGDSKKATADLEKALEFVPDYAPAIELLDSIERQ